MKTFSFVPSLLIMKRVHLFFDFTKERLGREAVPAEIVDTCLQAMQEGVLDVCAQNPYGRYVWSCYTMTLEQIIHPMTRICVVQELDRRRTWDAGLRRVWLAACTI
jgi:heme exporter protein D